MEEATTLDPSLKDKVKGITARSIMTPNPISASPKDTIEQVAELILANDIRHVPVVYGGKLIGIISERDLRSFTRPMVDQAEDLQAFKLKMQLPIQTIYRTDFVAIGPDFELEEILDVLLDTKVGAVPVVESRNYRLIGIVSYIDVLKQLRELI